jgi:hypothetical protein
MAAARAKSAHPFGNQRQGGRVMLGDWLLLRGKQIQRAYCVLLVNFFLGRFSEAQEGMSLCSLQAC